MLTERREGMLTPYVSFSTCPCLRERYRIVAMSHRRAQTTTLGTSKGACVLSLAQEKKR